MRQQEALQPALQAIWDQQHTTPRSGFAGVAFEGAGLTVYWKGALTEGMAAALSRAPAAGHVVVKTAAYSAAELEAASATIDKTIATVGENDIQSIGAEPNGSGLTVTKRPATTPKSSALATAGAKQSVVSAEQVVSASGVRVPVHFTTASVAAGPAADRFNNVPAWNGGDAWFTYHGSNPNSVAGCTTGFGVHSGNHSFVLTAAHCASVGDVVKSGTPGVVMGPVYSDLWQYDILLINAPGWHVIWDGPSWTTTRKNVNSWGYWAANELVCQSGMRSGTVCGIQELRNTPCTYWPKDHPDSDGDSGYCVHDLIECVHLDGTPASVGGDSGGPVFTLDGSGVRAKGITSAGNGDQGGSSFYFQDWWEISAYLNVYPNTTGSTS